MNIPVFLLFFGSMASVAAHSSPDLCAYCFSVLESYLDGSPPPSFLMNNDLEVGGIFVTWKSKNGRTHADLRGCVGCLSTVKLSKLAHYALQSSQSDSRFKPIQRCKTYIFLDYYVWFLQLNSPILKLAFPSCTLLSSCRPTWSFLLKLVNMVSL